MEKHAADLPAFTGLRGIAALLVLFFHVRTPNGAELTFGPLDAFSARGHFGVDAFFVLSGFILSHVYATTFASGVRSQDYKEFGLARFARIYPLHIATTGLMLVAFVIAARFGVQPTETSGYEPLAVLMSVLLINEWFGFVAPNASSWSISVELMNYIIFPPLIAVLAKAPKHWPIPAALLCALVASIPFPTNLLHGVAEFVMGCAAYEASKRYRAPFLGLASGPLFCLPFFLPHVGFGGAGLCFAASVYCLAQAANADPFNWLCRQRPIVFIGEISYSIYMLQWFVWVGWKHVIGRLSPFEQSPYLVALGASLTLIAVSTATYYLFERPAREWARKRGRMLSKTAAA